MKLEIYLPSGKLDLNLKPASEPFSVTVLKDTVVIGYSGREVEDTYHVTLSHEEYEDLK